MRKVLKWNMVVFLFIVSAIVSIIAANRLAAHTDIISKETRIGGMAAGMLLLAVATSLPELTASVSAAVIGNAAIVVGNGLGSILFNMFALFVLDLHFRQKRLFLKVDNNHTHTGVISLVLCTMAGLFLLIDIEEQFLNVSWMSLVMILTYFVGSWLVSKKEKAEKSPSKGTGEAEQRKSIRSTILWFAFFAMLIFISGSALSFTGDQIARTTGISATAVGSVLIALTTSLPDGVSVYTALKLGNPNLAVGAILGSNMFNVFVIPLSDFFYEEGSIWSHAGDQNILIAGVGFFLTAIVMLVLTRKTAKSNFTYILPSLIAVLAYLAIVGVVMFS